MALPQENVDWICGATDYVELQGGSLPSIGPLKRNIFIDENSPFSFVCSASVACASRLLIPHRNCGVVTAPSVSSLARSVDLIFVRLILMHGQGATQSYLLGQQLRSIYISTLRFIPSTFDPSLVYAAYVGFYAMLITIAWQVHPQHRHLEDAAVGRSQPPRSLPALLSQRRG